MEHQIFEFAKMTLRDLCSTSYDLASLFRGRRSTLPARSGTIAKRIGTRPSVLHSTFLFGRKYCLVFDVVSFKNGGSLAEFHRFGAENFHLRKSRRLFSFQTR